MGLGRRIKLSSLASRRVPCAAKGQNTSTSEACRNLWLHMTSIDDEYYIWAYKRSLDHESQSVERQNVIKVAEMMGLRESFFREADFLNSL